MRLLRPYNPFAFPGGRLPGFDPNHPGAIGVNRKKGFSGVAVNGGFVSLLDGSVGTIAGTPTGGIKGAIGQATTFTGSGDTISFASNSTAAATSITFAGIVLFDTSNGGGAFNSIISTEPNFNGAFLDSSGDNWTMQVNNISVSASLSPAFGTPYFFIMSNKAGAGGNVNFLFLNLATGQLTTKVVAATASAAATSGTYWLGNNTGASTYPMLGGLGAVMYAPKYMSMSAMRAWAADPWSFWYPPSLPSVIFSGINQASSPPPTFGAALNSDPKVFQQYLSQDKHTWVNSNVFLPKKRVFLTSGTTWVVPADYNGFNSQIECIAGGAGGDAVGGAGGGGAYASIFNLKLTPGATAAIQVGAAGSAGNPGTDTWLKSTATVLAKGGGAPTTTTGGAGGDSGTSVGFSTSSGGPGGSVATGNPGGGGGAGGPSGGGGNGGNGGVSLGGNGGPGDNGFGGTGGAGSASGTNPGNPGTEYDATHGSGGGGGGSVTSTGGAGGNYGAGGGGSLVTGGAGAPGLIIITYTPATVAPLGGWALNSDPPLPPGPLKQLFQSDLSLRFLSSATQTTPISGMAWWRPVENPQVKGSSVSADRNTGSTQPITFVLAQISGMAWWGPFDQPKFGPVAPDRMTNPPAFGNTVLLAPISGMAWWMPFVQPFFPTSVKYWEHQTELMAPPLATIYVMASTSDDQPQVKTGQRAWLSPQQALPWNTLPGPVGISGMAWYRNFDQPRFSTVFKPEEYPSFFETIISGTLPVGISGMAWFGPFDQPRFLTTYPVAQHPQETFTPQNFVTIADVAWYGQFDQPRFSTSYPIASQPAEAFTPPPMLITGIGWYVNLDQPFFPGLYKAYQQSPSAFVAAQTVLPTGISGIAWHRNFEQPFFPTAYKAWLQTSFFEALTPATDPVGISGMAWWRPNDQPFFKTAYKSELVAGTFSALTPSTLPAPISGIAWYQSFLQPKFSTAINASVQNYTTAWLYKPSPVVASLLQPIRISIGVGTGIDWTRGT